MARYRRIAAICAALAVATLLQSCSGPRYVARPGVDVEQTLRGFAHEGLDRHGLTGLSVALVDSGGLLTSFGVGWADRERGRRTTARTLYSVGSLSKPVTALTALSLVERGELGLDQPLAEILPGFRMREPTSTPVTIRSLITHHSGLPNVWRPRHADGRRVAFDELVSHLHSVPRVVEPWTRRHYSTLGYNLHVLNCPATQGHGCLG